MLNRIAKRIARALIGMGIPLPRLSRVDEYVQFKRLLDTINCVIVVGANRGQTVKLL